MLGGGHTGTALGTTTPGNINSISLTAGAWIIIANLFYPGTTFREMSISATSNAIDTNSVFSESGAGSFHLTRGVVITATTTYYLVATSIPSVTTQNQVFYAILTHENEQPIPFVAIADVVAIIFI